MDRLVNTAIIGTGQIPVISLATGSPVDEIIEQVPEESSERRLLLAAGAISIAHRAGYVATSLPEEPVAAETEERSYCSNQLAKILENLLQKRQDEHLLEALQLAGEAELILPPDLLTLALNSERPRLQALLYPLLGKRGLWLSQFQKRWSWVAEYGSSEHTATTQEDEKIWQEGTLEQRYKVLKRLRSLAPEQGRSWLANTWRSEQVEARKLFLNSLDEQLSENDEAFLEQARSDRSPEIREKAAELLAQLPNSAFSQRMYARAEKLLFWKGNKIEARFLTGANDTFWKHDGLEKDLDNAQIQWGWLTQILAHIPLKFWEQHFMKSPEEIVSGLNSENPSFHFMLLGWSKAAQYRDSHDSSGWLLPLWHRWHQQGRQAMRETQTYAILTTILKRVSQADGEEMLRASTGYETGWEHFLAELPRPWSKTFSSFFLQQLAEHIQKTESLTTYSSIWYNTLSTTAYSIHPDNFQQAMEISNPLTKKHGEMANWNRQFKLFREIIQVRKEIRQEITR